MSCPPPPTVQGRDALRGCDITAAELTPRKHTWISGPEPLSGHFFQATAEKKYKVRRYHSM